jgi:hypothetical protein
MSQNTFLKILRRKSFAPAFDFVNAAEMPLRNNLEAKETCYEKLSETDPFGRNSWCHGACWCGLRIPWWQRRYDPAQL